MKPEPRMLEPTRAHEEFYNDVMASALRLKLQDREIVALLALIVGRACGTAAAVGTEEDRATLVDTAVYNLHFGKEGAADLLKGLGKGH